MSNKQELIDYINAENANINILIQQKNQQKLSIDSAIAQQQSNIDYFNNQKAQCDIDIASHEANIAKNLEIIEIIEASN